MVSTVRFSPTICERRANAQLTDFHVCSSSEVTLPAMPPVIWKIGSLGSPSFGSRQPRMPSIRSPGWAPAWMAAARMKNLMLDPVWRGDSAMLTSFSFGTKPSPPTIARMAPLRLSSDTIAASKPWVFWGRTLRASSAFCWSDWLSVV